MKLIIAGSRSLDDSRVHSIIDKCVREAQYASRITEVVSGTAVGIDQAGERWAKINHYPIRRFPADWKAHGRPAGHIRNHLMAEYADALLAIWDQNSPGTRNMIQEMKRLNKPYYVYCPKDTL